MNQQVDRADLCELVYVLMRANKRTKLRILANMRRAHWVRPLPRNAPASQTDSPSRDLSLPQTVAHSAHSPPGSTITGCCCCCLTFVVVVGVSHINTHYVLCQSIWCSQTLASVVICCYYQSSKSTRSLQRYMAHIRVQLARP